MSLIYVSSKLWLVDGLETEDRKYKELSDKIIKEKIPFLEKDRKFEELKKQCSIEMEKRIEKINDRYETRKKLKLEIENEKECWMKWFIRFQIGGLFLSGLSGILVKTIKIGIGVRM